jgi:anti-sigma factor RsiW
MNCKENQKYLDAYVDGELEPNHMLEVESHLENCDSCQSLVLVKRRLVSELAEFGNIKAPEHLRKKVERLRGHGHRFRNWTIAAALPLAAAASLLIAFNLQGNTAPQEEQLAEVVNDVVARHAGALPMEVNGPDATQAASWFRGKVDFPVRAPSLNLQQASFEGARLSNVREHQAAHMTYNVEGHRVTLMIFNRQNTDLDAGRHVKVDNKDVVLGQRNGFNVAVLLDGDMAYALSSDLSQDRLLKLIRQMKM